MEARRRNVLASAAAVAALVFFFFLGGGGVVLLTRLRTFPVDVRVRVSQNSQVVSCDTFSFSLVILEPWGCLSTTQHKATG